MRALREALLAGVEAAGGDDRFDVIVLGLAAFEGPDSAVRFADEAQSVVTTPRIVVAVDVVPHYFGAVGLEPGVVIAAGTGSIALAMSASGEYRTADGWGFMLGDEGSGYWIGRNALGMALRTLDGRDSHPVIAQAAERRYGSLERVRDVVQSAKHPVSSVAGFAADVAELARLGDVDCIELWRRAGVELARTTAAAAQLTPDSETGTIVSWCGGLFEAGEILIRPFTEEVRFLLPAAQVLPPKSDALTGGWLVAMDRAIPLEASLIQAFDY
jgi:N-acetylglucosamine kinase-like BadF-type ATPase